MSKVFHFSTLLKQKNSTIIPDDVRGFHRGIMLLTIGVIEIAFKLEKTVLDVIASNGHKAICFNDELSELQLCIDKKMPNILIVTLDTNSMNNSLKFLAKLKTLPKTGIIYLSSNYTDELLQKISQTRFIQFLIWPTQIENLLSSIALSAYRHKLFFIELGTTYKYYPYSMELYKDKSLVKLTKNEQCLLNLFLNERGKVVPREHILQTIWPNKDISETTVRTLITRLRKKIEEIQIIKVSNIGYQFTRKPKSK